MKTRAFSLLIALLLWMPACPVRDEMPVPGDGLPPDAVMTQQSPSPSPPANNPPDTDIGGQQAGNDGGASSHEGEDTYTIVGRDLYAVSAQDHGCDNEYTYAIVGMDLSYRGVEIRHPVIEGMADGKAMALMNDAILEATLGQADRWLDSGKHLSGIGYEIPYRDGNYLSIIYTGWLDVGGMAFPVAYFTTVNMDMDSGRRLRFCDLVAADKKFYEMAEHALSDLGLKVDKNRHHIHYLWDGLLGGWSNRRDEVLDLLDTDGILGGYSYITAGRLGLSFRFVDPYMQEGHHTEIELDYADIEKWLLRKDLLGLAGDGIPADATTDAAGRAAGDGEPTQGDGEYAIHRAEYAHGDGVRIHYPQLEGMADSGKQDRINRHLREAAVYEVARTVHGGRDGADAVAGMAIGMDYEITYHDGSYLCVLYRGDIGYTGRNGAWTEEAMYNRITIEISNGRRLGIGDLVDIDDTFMDKFEPLLFSHFDENPRIKVPAYVEYYDHTVYDRAVEEIFISVDHDYFHPINGNFVYASLVMSHLTADSLVFTLNRSTKIRFEPGIILEMKYGDIREHLILEIR